MIEQSQRKSFYEFGPFVMDGGRRRLLRGSKEIPLTRKEFETLLVLVREGGRVVEKDKLMEAIWPDAHVEEGNIAVHISKLRGKLGIREDGVPYIETEAGRGYRFTARVREIEDFELVVRKRTRTHSITQEEEETEELPSLARTNVQAAAGAQVRLTRQKTLAAAIATVIVAAFVGGSFYFSQRRGAARAPIGVRTLAVLPFTLLNASEGEEYLGLGMTDALITRLSNVRQIVVRPTSAVRRLEGAHVGAAEAGARLGVDAVLEGSIQKSGDRLRVTAQLVRTKDGAPLWAGTFVERLTDVFTVQDAISQQLTTALALKLTDEERGRMTRRYTENADAYQLYANGRYSWSRRDFEGMTRAESLFRKAIERDTNFAPAYVGLADTLAMTEGARHEVELAQAKALALAPDMAEAHASRGFTNMFHHWDWAGAERDLRRAIELNPGYGTAHQWLATLLAITGRTKEAKTAMRRALEIDPRSPNFLADMGQMHYFAREYPEAEEFCRRALEVEPEFPYGHGYLSEIYLKTGRRYEALEQWLLSNKVLSPQGKYADVEEEKDRRAALENHRREGMISYIREYLGRTERNEAAVRNSAVQYQLAHFYVVLGEKEQALKWLDKAIASRDFMAAFFRADPIFDDLREDPRYQALVRRANLPP